MREGRLHVLCFCVGAMMPMMNNVLISLFFVPFGGSTQQPFYIDKKLSDAVKKPDIWGERVGCLPGFDDPSVLYVDTTTSNWKLKAGRVKWPVWVRVVQRLPSYASFFLFFVADRSRLCAIAGKSGRVPCFCRLAQHTELTCSWKERKIEDLFWGKGEEGN